MTATKLFPRDIAYALSGAYPGVLDESRAGEC